MSWLSLRDAQNADHYRYIQFEGGRILQAKELSDLQTADAARLKMCQSAVFRDGALANGQALIAGSNLSLSRLHVELPAAMVFVNGYFEPFPDTTVALPAPLTSGISTLYAHWVIWRVTFDGNYISTPGCIVDAALTDLVTSEAVAERGQLQVIFSFDQTLSAETLDPIRMISKSTAGNLVLQVLWTASVASVVPQNNFQIYLGGNPTQLGVVKLSTATSDTAAATDDTRMSDARTPLASSVSTLKLSDPELTGGSPTDIASPEVRTGSGNGGVDVSKLWWGTLRAKLSDVLTYLYTQTGLAITALNGHNSRITALENKATPVIDLSYHIGKPLGKSADGGFSHLPEVRDANGGYKAFGPNGMANATTPYGGYPWAFLALNEAEVPTGGISHAGTYVLLNPLQKAVLDRMTNNTYDLANYYSLAQIVGLMGQRLGYFG